MISYMPERIMYIFSDALYFLVYRMIGYRKEIVRTNLKNSFPDKNATERLAIEKEFFKHLTDLILETVSIIHMSKTRFRRQVNFTNYDFLKKYKQNSKSLIFVSGHMGNWEMFGSRYAMENLHPIYVLYSPLQNPYFDRLVYRMRSGSGAILVPMKDTYRNMLKNRDILTATGFIADQTPSPENAYWTPFLNQSTPFFTGPAKMSKKFNYPVIYFSLKKKSRGRYDVQPEVLVKNPSELTEDEITECFVKRLEQDIREMPFNWLWSHRRWKHKPPAGK